MKKRLLSLLLALTMVLSMLPVSVFAAEGETVKGESVVVDANGALVAQREVNFNKNWKFYLGNNESAANKNFDDSSWTDVNLPHDFSIIQHFTTTNAEGESGFLPGGTGWYRKTFIMPQEAEGQTVLLNFDGVYMHAYVYVNGQSVGEHHFGYSNFAMDISDYLICDGASENVISVKAVNNFPSSRWYSGSGIYRDVTLLMLDPVHVDLHGTQITTPDIASGNGTVNVKVDVVNDGEAEVTATVKNSVYTKGGDTAVATAESNVTVAAGASAPATNAPVVSGPALWSLENPNLYTVKTEVIVGGKVVDTYETDFGFRWFSWSNQGFALNGKNVKLDGVCLHHDQGAAGSAAYYDAMYRQISIMKEMGCNAIRTAHNPADEHFIQICNELGMLVIEESFDGLTVAKNGNYNDFSTYFQRDVDTKLHGAKDGMICAEYSVRSIVKRDRNAPAIIAWSYGNEIQEGASFAENFVTYCGQYINWVNNEDGTRKITIGDNTRGSNTGIRRVVQTILDAGGIAGYNYANTITDSGDRALDLLVQNYSGQNGCIIASETSSHTNSRGQYRNQNDNRDSDGKGHLTSYDTSAVSWGTKAHDSIYNTYYFDEVAGEFVWTGFDYIGEPTPWNDPYDSSSDIAHNSAYFGIVETTGFEKDSYYLYRSQWHDSATTLHLVTAWDDGNMMTSGGKTPVWVYSNAPVVKLYRDGIHIGTATRTVNETPAGHVTYTYKTETVDPSICSVQDQSGADALYAIFNVAYKAGTLSAKAFQEDGVTEIQLKGNSGKHTVTTPDSVTKLAISQNRTTAPADESSLIYVEVDVVDENGNLDTTATNNITFTVEGPGVIVGVDNGDQNTVKKYQNSYVKTSDTTANINAYAGKALVIVRTTDEAGEIRVNVASGDLTGAAAVVNATEVDNTETTGLQTYTMIRDYSIHEGVDPTMDTAAIGTLADGSTVNGTIVWDEVSEDVYGTAGDHTVTGTLTFPDMAPVKVTARLHVIPNVIAVRNISTATFAGVVPALPNTVKGIMPDGTLAGDFEVKWDAVDAADLETIGDLVVVKGKATILADEQMDVTCTIRVAETVMAGSKNIGPEAETLTQDIPAGYTADNLNSVNDGVTKPNHSDQTRWTNWNYHSTQNHATITMTWATAHQIHSVDLFYYTDGSVDVPGSVEFQYSLNGKDYTTIAYEEEFVESYSYGSHYTYTFEQPVSPVGMKVKLTEKTGKYIGLTEIVVNSALASIETNTTANLTGITVDGTAIDGFQGDVLNYVAGNGENIAATTDKNVGITVLPEYKGVVRILTVAEDGSAAQTYAITVDESAIEWVEENISLKVGQTEVIKIETGNYADQVNDDEWKADVAILTVVGVDGHEASASEAVTALESGKQYILHNDRANKGVTTGITTPGVASASGDTSGFEMLAYSESAIPANMLWTLTKVSDGVYTIQAPNGQFVTMADNSASLSGTPSNITFEYVDGYWLIHSGIVYLNDAASAGNCAAGWDSTGEKWDARTDAGSKWTIYEYIPAEETSTTITIEGKSAGETSFTMGTTRYNIEVIAVEPAVLTLDYNDGVTTNEERTLTKGDKLGELPVPTRDGYNFAGWFNGETQVNAETVIEGDMTIVAKWNEAPIDLRNISTATRVGVVPTLPETVRGVKADGTLMGEFQVDWETVDASKLVAGAYVVVTGTVEETDVNGDPLDVTCTIRVANAAPATTTNVALNATVSQDIPEDLWSDNMDTINDGVTNPQSPEIEGESDTRWSNYKSMLEGDMDAVLTLEWDTVQPIREIDLYFRVDGYSAQLPGDVMITYSLDGVEFVEMDYSAASNTSVSISYGEKWVYELDAPINCKALQLKFTNASEDNCVSVYEIEAYTITDADALILNSFASLSTITADGNAIKNFSSNTTAYEIRGNADAVIGAATETNAGITILPIYEDVVRILTVAEDGVAEKTYEITFAPECPHARTELRGGAEATCEDPGYTGDTWCLDCGEKIETGTEIPAKGHAYGEPDFNWDDDYSATATFVCATDDTHVVVLEATVTSEPTEGDCETGVTVIYTATVTFEETAYTDTMEDTSEGGGHQYVNGFCSACDAYEPAKLNEEGVYEISNAGQLYWFAALVNGDTDAVPGIVQNAAADAVLTADITVNEKVLDNGALVSDTAALRPWAPIGRYQKVGTRVKYDVTYTGSFDGQGHTISGLYLVSTEAGTYENIALFGQVGLGIDIKNVGVSDTYFRGVQYIGGIVGEAYSSDKNNPMLITNCWAENSIITATTNYVGGIVGHALRHARITECTNSATVTGGGNAGGIIGYCGDGTTVTDCFNEGTISGNKSVGGIAGSNNGGNFTKNLSRCANTGDVTGTSEVGGVVGQNASVMEDCYNTGDVTGTGSNVGGVAGYNVNKRASVEDCYNTGAVTSTASAYGPIVGGSSNAPADSVKNCYYLAASETDSQNGIAAKTEAQFASGEITWLLNDDDSNVWKQTLTGENADKAPVFEGENVYWGYDSCADDAQPGYSNNSATSETKPEHTDEPKDHECDICGEDVGEHVAAEGSHNCEYCGKPASECADDATDGDHKCEICGEAMEGAECTDTDKNHKCDDCKADMGKHEDTDKDHDCEYGCSETIGSCEDKDNNGKCDYGCDKEFEVEPEPTEPEPTEPKPTEPVPTEPEATEPEAPKVEGVTRLAGENRLVTSELIADQLKEQMGVEKFENIIVASGGTFADALPGSYLAAVKNAPIILTLAKQKYIDQTAAYIKANLVEGGTVYILGGESAVPTLMETALTGINVKRVAGADRFGTNLAILKEAGVKEGDEILVCTAKEFADSLSAAATGKPILLVYKKITDEQKAYLATLSGNTFCVVGGTSAVPENLEEAMKAYGEVSRLAGKDRLDTSILVAKKYFPDATTSVVAYGWDFPDGLCGGSLAYATKSPLILAHSKEKLFQFTADYTVEAGLTAGFVLGGDKLVTDDATRAIFGMAQADPITLIQ